MRTGSIFRNVAVSLSILTLAFFVSCREESPLTVEADYVVEEALTDTYYEDADDMAGLSLMATDETDTGISAGKADASGGRLVGNIFNDGRFTCATVTVELNDDNTFERPKGKITIDFGDGCEDAKGNVRKGKIIIYFDGRRFHPGSFYIITFEDYSINDIQLEGVRTITNLNESSAENPKFEIKLKNGKATWPDGTFATREHLFIREWVLYNTRAEDHLIVTGSAEGINRRGFAYEMEIIKPLIYKRGCPIAIAGVKVFKTRNSVITIDYGDRECDRAVVIKVNGNQQDIRISQ